MTSQLEPKPSKDAGSTPGVPLVIDAGWALRQSHDNYTVRQRIQTSLRMTTLQAVDGDLHAVYGKTGIKF